MSKLLLIALFCVATLSAFAQESGAQSYTFSQGLAVKAGVGYSAIRDEFISVEKYSGSLPYIALSWSRFRDSSGYRLSFEFEPTSNLKNHNISAEVTQAAFQLEYLYPIGILPFASDDVFLVAGPSAEFFLHFRNQNLASGGSSIFNAISFSALMSAAAKVEAYYPLNDAFQIAFATRLNLVSLGARMVNPENNDVSAINILTPFSALRFYAEIGVHYRIANPLVVALGYQFRYTRITGWDYFLSGSDTLIAAVSYDL